MISRTLWWVIAPVFTRKTTFVRCSAMLRGHFLCTCGQRQDLLEPVKWHLQHSATILENVFPSLAYRYPLGSYDDFDFGDTELLHSRTSCTNIFSFSQSVRRWWVEGGSEKIRLARDGSGWVSEEERLRDVCRGWKRDAFWGKKDSEEGRFSNFLVR